MVSAIISGVSALASLLGGVAGKSESDKLAAKIRKQQLTTPPEVESLLGSAKTLSAMGMPGYETYEEQIGETMPQTAQAARETAQSPSSIIDLYAKSMAQANKAYNELAVQDAAARRQNILNYQNVLGQVAQMRTGIQQANIQTNLSALAQEAQGTKELISGIANAPGAFIQSYIGMEQSGAGQDIENLLSGTKKQTAAQIPSAYSYPNIPATAPLGSLTTGESPLQALYNAQSRYPAYPATAPFDYSILQ